jgi:hypothetical protein
MRLIAVFLSLLFLASATYAEDDPNYLYSLTFKRGPTVTRYAKPEFVESLRSARPEGVNLAWKIEATDEEAKALAEREIEVINLVIRDVIRLHEGSVLVLSSIVLNREGLWAFYTSDGAALASALEAGLKGKTRSPVRVRTGRDPDWKAFTGFLTRLREEG